MLRMLVLALMPGAVAPVTFSHRDLGTVLERFVDDRGLVDYCGLSRDRKALDAYLASLARSSPDSNPALFPTRDDQLAYWLNAYNAFVIAGVLDRGVDAAMREFVADERHCRVDVSKRTVWLSKIFDWFENDFLDYERSTGNARPSVVQYVNRYREAALHLGPSFRVRYADYDKRLNSQ